MTTLRACPVCGEQCAKTLFRPKQSPGPVGVCGHCGMAYIWQIEDDKALIFEGPVTYDSIDQKVLTSADLNDVSGSWELSMLPDKEVEWPALRKNAMDALGRIEQYIGRPREKILDFGSGWGFFLAVAKEQGWQSYGIEPLPGTSVYARATFGLHIVTDTLREDLFPPNFFDAITSFQVFEHLPYPDRDIGYLRKMLRENGILLIEVPNFNTWTMRLLKSKHRHFVQDHLNFFSIETLSRILRQNRFEVVDTYYTERSMSVRHLIKYWVRRYLPFRVVDSFQGALQRTGMWERTIGINIGDIITVIARKI